MTKIKKLILLGFMFGTASIANATLLTSDTISNSTIVDFSTQVTASNIVGPIQVGGLVGEDIAVTGSPNTGLYTNYNGWWLLSNGSWGGGMTYISADDARPGSLLFLFNDGPVSAVGGFINHVPGLGTDLFISVLNAAMVVLESYNVTSLANIVTPNGVNAGGFRGIDRGVNDIHYFEVTGYVPVLDNLTFTRGDASVSAPATLALFGLGLAGLGWSRRKKA